MLKRSMLRCVAIVVGVLLLTDFYLERSSGEETTIARPANAIDLGLQLTPGEFKPGDGRRVLIEEDPVVCRVHLEIGETIVALKPNGRLVSVPINETQSTDRPFEPFNKKQLTDQILRDEFPGFQTKSTNRYLYIFNASDSFVRGTGRILETMFPGLFNYCQKRGLKVSQPEFPLVVILFKTEKEFQEYRRMPQGVVAYYNTLSNYIVMYEQSELTDVNPELALKQSISTIAHEGVHQVLHNIGVQQRLSTWPIWISEGLAEYFAPTSVTKRIHWKGVGFPNDLRMYELFQFQEKNFHGNSAHGQLLRNTVQAKNINSLGYACSWSTVNYLAKRKQREFTAYLQEVSQIGPLDERLPGELFEKHFGSDFATLEAVMFKHLRSMEYLDPTEFQTYYVISLRNDKKPIVTTSQSTIRRLREKEKLSDIRVRAFANRTQAQKYAAYLKGRP